MIDLPIGTKFYFDDKLVEVVECDMESKCSSCVFHKQIFEGYDYDEYIPCCSVMNCWYDSRHDRRKDVCFKEVKE